MTSKKGTTVSAEVSPPERRESREGRKDILESSPPQRKTVASKQRDIGSDETQQFEVSSMQAGLQSPSRPNTSSPIGGQNPLVHEIHTHPHRRHYPHHLLDHFSGDLIRQDSSCGTWRDVVRTVDPATAEIVPQEHDPAVEQQHVAGSRLRAESELRHLEVSTPRVTTSPDIQPERSSKRDSVVSSTCESQQWPFFGTESRILPSGRRVSFLKQACWGFSHSSNQSRDQVDNKNMNAVCPKAFREPSIAPRRSILRTGPRVAELKERFTARDQSPTVKTMGQIQVDIDKFRYESVKGPSPSVDSLHANIEERSVRETMQPRATIIDSSSTKGSHPVPKAPGIRSPVSPNRSKSVRSHTATKCGDFPKHAATCKRPQTKPTSPSPTRRTDPPSPRSETEVGRFTGAGRVSKTGKGPRIIQSKSNASPVRKTKLSVDKDPKPFQPSPASNRKYPRNRTKQTVRTIAEKPAESPSSESLEDCTSLVVLGGENEASSTYEELSMDSSDLSDRNFLIDYGDPSKFYFRNEWEARMRELGNTTGRIRQNFRSICDNDEVYEGLMNAVDEMETVKLEMEELYDYFDHFEREEDTLLQQVQRQLNHANRFCRIQRYRLERAEKQRADNSRIEELEEELKLSRQVAVSLHWELQTADTKQVKLEKDNFSLRERLLSAETATHALRTQVAKLQYNIDQMSLHAPSQVAGLDDSEEATSSDSASELRRQIQFMGEKETVMIARLVDLQREKDSLKDELDQYKDQYGELASAPAPGANRQTDLKLRMKLAEDQAGLLARKVIELQLENDNMVKIAAERDLMAKEAMKRNPSVSDLQFLEDERESLRLALDEMEIENQKLAAELLRYKQAVHRQLHSNSASTESPLDVGIVLRVPRSNDSVFDDEKLTSRSHKSDDKTHSYHDSPSEHHSGDRKKLRPLSLTSPSNHSQKRSQISFSRTLSDLALPLSPDTKNQSVQITPTNSNTALGPKSTSVTSGSRKSFCHKCKKSKKVKTADAAVETDAERPKTLIDSRKKSTSTSTLDSTKDFTRSQATSPMISSLHNLFQPVVNVATQIRNSTKSKGTSPIKPISPRGGATAYSPSRISPRPHNALLEEMRKQLANVRNIAESMDTVVNVEEIDAELQKKGRELVNAEYKRVKDGTTQKKKISKLAKSLQKYIRDMEESVADESEKSGADVDGQSLDVTGWNLHGNADFASNVDTSCAGDSSTLTVESTSSEFEALSVQTVRSLATKFRQKPSRQLCLKVLEAIVVIFILYILVTSLPLSATIRICFLLLVFFVC